MASCHAAIAYPFPVAAGYANITQAGVQQVKPLRYIFAPPGVTKVRELAVDALPVTKVRELAVDAPPGVTKVRELAVDALPGVTKVRELAAINYFFAIPHPRAASGTPTRANPITRAPAPPPRYFCIVIIRVMQSLA